MMDSRSDELSETCERPRRDPFDGLSVAVKYWPDRWSAHTLAAAMSMALAATSSDLGAQQWTDVLDHIEANLSFLREGEGDPDETWEHAPITLDESLGCGG